ncbi:MAG TPA: hypothetical protein VI685_11325 [Candidatus Angelobacter sp.]
MRKGCEVAHGTILQPHGAPKENPESTGRAAAKKAVEIAVGEVLGDGLPIMLDPASVLPPVDPPVDFHPTEISCAPGNVTPLKPGDYSCQVLLYCMKDGDHWPAPHAPYGFSALQGRLAEPTATLLNRGAAAGIDPTVLQAISWSIQASVPLSQMPAPYQEVVYRLLPETDLIEGLKGDFLERVTAAYLPFQFVPGMPSLDVLLGELGDPGRIIQDIRRSHQIIKEETLNFERLSERLYHGPPGQQVLPLPGLMPASQWSQIRPGVIAQLVVTTGNLRLNHLNFRVLQNAASSEPPRQAQLINASYPQVGLTSSSDVITIAELFGAIVQPEAAPGLLGDVLRRRFGQALIGYALYGIRTQALLMAMPTGRSDDGCAEEWEAARELCSKELAKPNPNRGITGGHANIEDCARGHVSERCGGNPIDWGKH